jgi:hypothetical protein
VAKKLLALAALGVASLSALALGVGNASAGLLGCNYPASGQAFTQWGDSSKYVPVPGGSFESGAGGWTLSGGAKVVSGNEPFYLGSPTDSHSLVLPPGSSATSPGVCLSLLTPTLRFVGSSSNGSAVHVTMYTKTLLGLVRLPTYTDLTLSSSWDASETAHFLLQNVLGLVNLGNQNIYFRFAPAGNATVQMDDVLLDPTFCE